MPGNNLKKIQHGKCEYILFPGSQLNIPYKLIKGYTCWFLGFVRHQVNKSIVAMIIIIMILYSAKLKQTKNRSHRAQ